MKREEAVAIYKEILNLGEHMRSNSFNLKLSKIGDPTSEGDQICITMLSDGSVKEQIAYIAKTHNLAVREEKG
jgi:ribosomal protein L18E